MRRYVAIEGNIGAGKTTLARMLASHWDAELLLEEFEDNPFLPQFYENPERHAFAVELYFLADRYHQLRQRLSNPSLFHQLTVSDYFMGKSLIFSATNLRDDEYDLFSRLFHIMFETLPKPDLLVYLYLDVERSLDQIKKRGRPYEQQITADYLQRVQERYLQFIRQQPGLTSLVIDMKDADFVDDISVYESVLDLTGRNYEQGFHTAVIKGS